MNLPRTQPNVSFLVIFITLYPFLCFAVFALKTSADNEQHIERAGHMHGAAAFKKLKLTGKTRQGIFAFNFSKTYKNFSKSKSLVNNGLHRRARSVRTAKARTRHRSDHKGRKKSSEVVRIEKHGRNHLVTVLPVISSLCPVWPKDQRLLTSCSNGRKLRSVCLVTCAPGFRLREGSPRRRRCRIHRRRKTKTLRIAWSEKDAHFACDPICDKLPAPDHGRLVCADQEQNGSITSPLFRSCALTCESGFAPSLSSPRLCLPNGTWSGTTATCRAVSLKHRRPLFTLHHQMNCGNVKSIAIFSRGGTIFLVAGDLAENRTRVFRLKNGRFVQQQTIETVRPLIVEVISKNRPHPRLLVGNEKSTTFYYLNDREQFVFGRTRTDFFMTSSSNGVHSTPKEGLNYLQSGSDIYRCKGQRSKSGRSIVMVQKLKKGRRLLYTRVMRKKFRKYFSMHQCSMFVLDHKLHVVVSINRPGGKGKVLVGVAQKHRMKVIHVVSRSARHVTDHKVFQTSNGKSYMVLAQAKPAGRCYVYEWKGRELGAS